MLHALSALLIATKPTEPEISPGCVRHWRGKDEARTTCKGYSLGRRGEPLRERFSADLVSEPDHASNGLPAVLTEPAKDNDSIVKRYYDESRLVLTTRLHGARHRSSLHLEGSMQGSRSIQIIQVYRTHVGGSIVRVEKVGVAREDGNPAVWVSAVHEPPRGMKSAASF